MRFQSTMRVSSTASASLAREGFALIRQDSGVNDFYDDDEVRRVYYPEAEWLIKRATGADRVLIFDHTVRKRIDGAADRRGAGPRQPAWRVHVDHTEKSGPQRVRDLLPAEADQLLKGGVQIISSTDNRSAVRCGMRRWRCTVRKRSSFSTNWSDRIWFIPTASARPYSVKYNPDHRWFYVPGMTVDEILLLKCFDSKTDGRARFAPHSAFVDPMTPADAAPRESIGLRTLVFHAR